MLRKTSSSLCPPNHVTGRAKDGCPLSNSFAALPHTATFSGLLGSIKLDLLPRDDFLLIFRLLLKLIALDRAFFTAKRILREIDLLVARKRRARSIRRGLRRIVARLDGSLHRDKLAYDFGSVRRLSDQILTLTFKLGNPRSRIVLRGSNVLLDLSDVRLLRFNDGVAPSIIANVIAPGRAHDEHEHTQYGE